MKKNILFLTLGILLTACSGPESRQSTGTANAQYRTTAPSLLYFKNMRSSYYDQTEQAGTRIELYRLRKFGLPTQQAALIPIIANNWLEDEAYLFLETSGPDFTTPITVRWEGDNSQGTYQLQPATVEQQYELALQLYESIRAGHQLSTLAADSTWVPTLAEEGMRNNYATTVRDYLRLTEAL